MVNSFSFEDILFQFAVLLFKINTKVKSGNLIGTNTCFLNKKGREVFQK